jgi:hypothetical protein
MTISTEQTQEIYEAAVHEEATGNEGAAFELLCKLDDTGGTGSTIRKLIDMVRARDVELLAVREAQSKPVGMQYRLQVPNITGWSLWHNGDGDKYREHYEVQQRLVYAAPPTLPANVIGRPATPDDSPYPATISGGCLLAQAWADGYNVRNAVTAAPAVPAELLDAMAEVIRISDRDHEAWNRAKDAISAYRAASH